MSRITSDKINLGNSIVVDFFANEEFEEKKEREEEENEEPAISTEVLNRLNLLEKEAQDKAQKILDEANAKSEEIINAASQEAQEIRSKASAEVDILNKNANEILTQAQEQAKNTLDEANAKAQQIKEEASQQGAKEGYEAGYSDGLNKIKEEMLQKIHGMDEIVKNTFEMKQKILKSSKEEIVNLVLMIARKISINSVDAQSVASLVSKSLSLLSDKENIELILSEKYARLLNEVLSGNLSPDENCADDIDIDKLRNIKLTYNSKFPDDTLIIQTPKERLDLSFEQQLNQISNEFLKELNSSDDDGEDSGIG